MNDLDPQSLPFPLEWLAGYADGELTPGQIAQVEAFLADHPTWMAESQTQREMSFRTPDATQRLQPPSVSESGWTRVFVGIEMGLEPPHTVSVLERSRNWQPLFALAGAILLASLFFLLPAPLVPVREASVRAPELHEAIQIASHAEIQIISLDETAAAGLIVGDHPLAIDPIVLASFEEVDLQGVGPDLLGEFPELQMTPHGATTPMIWARADLRVSKEP